MSYRLLAPIKPSTSYFFPLASTTIALDAPTNGLHCEIASPLELTKTPYEVSNNEPSARNVLKEKTALAAFLTNEFCPNTDKDIKDITKQIVKYRSVFMLC